MPAGQLSHHVMRSTPRVTNRPPIPSPPTPFCPHLHYCPTLCMSILNCLRPSPIPSHLVPSYCTAMHATHVSVACTCLMSNSTARKARHAGVGRTYISGWSAYAQQAKHDGPADCLGDLFPVHTSGQSHCMHHQSPQQSPLQRPQQR